MVGLLLRVCGSLALLILAAAISIGDYPRLRVFPLFLALLAVIVWLPKVPPAYGSARVSKRIWVSAFFLGVIAAIVIGWRESLK